MYKWVDHSSGSYYVQISDNRVCEQLEYCYPSVYSFGDEVIVDTGRCAGKFLGMEAAKKAVEDFYA